MVMVMLLMPVRMIAAAQKLGVDVQGGVEVEAVQIQHVLNVHRAKVRNMPGRTRVHVLQAVGQCTQGFGADQVGFADKNLVRETHLAPGFLAFVELVGRVFGIHQGQDGVQQVGLGHLIVHKKGLRHRAGVGQAGGFDDDAVKVQFAFALFLCQILQGSAQVFADGAADAAIAHLDDLFLGVAHQNIAVDVFLAEFVFDDRDFLAVRLGQYAFEQSGLART